MRESGDEAGAGKLRPPSPALPTQGREYPTAPIVAVGAIVRKGDTVLLVKRGQAPGKGRWVISGGAVELGETVQEAVRREIREECGLEIVLGPLAAVVDRIDRDTAGRVRFHYVIIDYFADYLSGNLQPASDVAEARWVSAAELAQYDLTPKSVELLRQSLDGETQDSGAADGGSKR